MRPRNDMMPHFNATHRPRTPGIADGSGGRPVGGPQAEPLRTNQKSLRVGDSRSAATGNTRGNQAKSGALRKLAQDLRFL
jgi:hypothetical protein